MQTSGLQKSQQTCSEAWCGEQLCSERPLRGLAGMSIWSPALSLWDLACHHPSAWAWAGGVGTSVQSQLSSHQLHLSESFSALSETELALTTAELPWLPLQRPAGD